eukprot:scaffold24563_cov43-Cyclotella_meneghiniana.AAC.2
MSHYGPAAKYDWALNRHCPVVPPPPYQQRPTSQGMPRPCPPPPLPLRPPPSSRRGQFGHQLMMENVNSTSLMQSGSVPPPPPPPPHHQRSPPHHQRSHSQQVSHIHTQLPTAQWASQLPMVPYQLRLMQPQQMHQFARPTPVPQPAHPLVPRPNSRRSTLQPSPTARVDLPKAAKQTHIPQSLITTNQSTQGEFDSGWKQYIHEGRAFYHNSITKVSTFDRPVCLGLAQQSTQTQLQQTNAKWKIYTDKNSGKKYYSNGLITTWTRPVQLEPEDNIIEPSNTTVAYGDTNKRKRESNNTEIKYMYGSKLEAVAAFKGLLLSKNVTPENKWIEVQKLCDQDVRWKALSSIGERKQALTEYQTKRSNELKELNRIEIARGKEAYMRFLSDVLKDLDYHNLRYEDVRDILTKDNRHDVVEDEGMRVELFYDYVKESRKRKERTERMKKCEAKEGFIGLLSLYEDQGKVTFASTWMSFISSLNEEEKNNPKFTVSSHMTDSDRQLFFADYVIQLQTNEDNKQRRILESNQRAEKAQRNAYRDAIRAMAESGYIRPDTRWRSAQELLSRHVAHDPVYAQRPEAPRELFEDFIEEWNEEYRRERVTLNRALSLNKLSGNEKLSLYEFRKHLLESASAMPDLYAEVKRILIREDNLSSTFLFHEELFMNGNRNSVIGDEKDGSSEDEGEIVE